MISTRASRFVRPESAMAHALASGVPTPGHESCENVRVAALSPLAIEEPREMSVGPILLVVLVLLLVGLRPAWPYSGSRGYVPAGVVGVLLVVLVFLWVLGGL